jgi:putative peptidoglycan lipid II flippase
MALGAGAFQVNVVIDGFLAMWAAPWAPAAIQYADLIVYLPLGLIGNAFGTVLLPTFSHQAAQGDREGMRTTLEGALRHVLLIMAPAVVALTVLALPIAEAIYVWPRGKFGDQDAIWTMRALAGLAPGLLFFGAQKTLTPAFYALQDARTPLRIALWGVGLNLVLNVLFVLTWPPGWKHVGLVVSTVIASAVNTVALASELRRRAGAPQWAALAPAARAAATAMLGMGLAAWASHAWLREALAPLHPAKLAQVAALAGAGVVSAVVYLLIVRVLCPQDLKDIVRDFLHRPGGKA